MATLTGNARTASNPDNRPNHGGWASSTMTETTATQCTPLPTRLETTGGCSQGA